MMGKLPFIWMMKPKRRCAPRVNPTAFPSANGLRSGSRTTPGPIGRQASASGPGLGGSAIGRANPPSFDQGRQARSAVTMPTYILDTITVIDDKGKVAERLLAVAPQEITLPAIAAYEVWLGVLGSRNAKRREIQ
jgi:hypothetical protein